MIISMKPDATQEQIDHVCERIREFGYKVHSIQGEERVVIGVIGVGDVSACLEAIEVAPGVASAVRISSPFKFVSKEFKQQRTQIPINGVSIGGDRFVVMAGPCSVESEKPDHGSGGICGFGGRQDSARRRLQASHFPLRLPGHGIGRVEVACQGARGNRPRHRHRGDERAGRCR